MITDKTEAGNDKPSESSSGLNLLSIVGDTQKPAETRSNSFGETSLGLPVLDLTSSGTRDYMPPNSNISYPDGAHAQVNSDADGNVNKITFFKTEQKGADSTTLLKDSVGNWSEVTANGESFKLPNLKSITLSQSGYLQFVDNDRSGMGFGNDMRGAFAPDYREHNLQLPSEGEIVDKRYR